MVLSQHSKHNADICESALKFLKIFGNNANEMNQTSNEAYEK